jgi:hypothetical protein
MNKNTGKQEWVEPKLEQIAMVDTAVKSTDFNEAVTSGREMLMSAAGMQS